MAWERICDPASKRLLFRLDSTRGLIEIVLVYWDAEERKRVRYPVVVDLIPLLQAQLLPPPERIESRI